MKLIRYYLGALVQYMDEIKRLVIACLMAPWVVVLLVWAFTGNGEAT